MKSTFKNNNIKRKEVLIVIVSGPSGGAHSNLVLEASKKLCKIGDILNIQYSNDERFQDEELAYYKNLNLESYKRDFELAIFELNSDEYKTIFFISHSYQALVSLYICSKSRVIMDKLIYHIFWDPSTKENIVSSVENSFVLENGVYYSDINKRNEISFSSDHINELKSFNSKDIFKNLVNNTLVITAYNAGEHIVEEYKKIKNNRVEYYTIRNCGHNFGTYIAKKELFNKTIYFINKQLRLLKPHF